ncbi:MAG: 4Fe-4S dicluster domain-containing protein [Patescibacteria group bacterium]
MKIKDFKRLLIFLETKGYQLIGPQIKNGQVALDYLSVKNFNFQTLGKMPFYSFKKLFLPSREKLFEFIPNQKIRAILSPESSKLAIFGFSTLDLKALNLWRQVFEKDIYFQKRFKNVLIIGYGPAPEEEGQFRLWQPQYEEDILEHIQFDIFLMKRGSQLEIFTGTRVGQKLLDEMGYKNYQHVQFTGIIKEEGVEPWVIEVRDKLRKMTPQDSLWQELGRKCIECGKCSIVCPTCFCFDINDKIVNHTNSITNNYESVRERCWASCFYHEFSEIAGGQKFLKTTAERIYFWYYHKFVRIPDEYSIPGCIGCGRCTKVCPVGIDICRVLEQIRGQKKAKKCELPR